ncbi:MAG: D-aminoacyl-tRNA deacylase [Fimbriiglobus sp.]
MRAVLQRVSSARVRIAGEVVGEIGVGWLVLLGITTTDTLAEAEKLADKIVGLRAFADEAGKMNLAVTDVNGGVLVVSNFTLYADTSKGRRPNFLQAARPEHAEPLYEGFLLALRRLGIPTSSGRFGADMQIDLTNDGPVTILMGD